MTLKLKKDGSGIDRRTIPRGHRTPTLRANDAPADAAKVEANARLAVLTTRLAALGAAEAEKSLLKFIQMMWSVLEPSRAFVSGWAIEAICAHLEAVTRGEIRKLLMNVPPGFMKSMATQVFWPAWEWGPAGKPSTRYVGASYSEQLTVRDNRRCRQLITSELYQSFWGSRFVLTDDQNAKVRYDNDKTGFKIATSVGGMGTGERGDRFIVDDPHNVKESESEVKREETLRWFTEVVPTRINDAGKSAIIVIMQRVHERDVSGLILAKELGYTHLCIPMEYERDHPYQSKTTVFLRGAPYADPRKEDGELAWPDRFSRDYLETDLKPAMRAWGGTYAEAGQLQQRPSPRGGGMFKEDDWGFVDAVPANIVMRVRGWDLAATEDNPSAARTAGVRMSMDGERRIYIEHVVAGQWSDKGVEDKMRQCAETDPPGTIIDFPQDPGQAGKAQRAYLARQLQGYLVHSSPETGEKSDRARPLAAQQESRNVFLVRGSWNEGFIREASMFPTGHWKDQVDAASRAYARLLTKRETSVGQGGRYYMASPSEGGGDY